jgi:hypothetical protein
VAAGQPAPARSRFVAGNLLAAVTGLPEALLSHAVVELREPELDWLAYRHEPQPDPCG